MKQKSNPVQEKSFAFAVRIVKQFESLHNDAEELAKMLFKIIQNSKS